MLGRVIHIGTSAPTVQQSAPKGPEGWAAAEQGQRTQLLLGNQKIDSTGVFLGSTKNNLDLGRTMADARALGLESEQVGAGALTELQRQRGVLEGAQTDVSQYPFLTA